MRSIRRQAQKPRAVIRTSSADDFVKMATDSEVCRHLAVVVPTRGLGSLARVAIRRAMRQRVARSRQPARYGYDRQQRGTHGSARAGMS